MPEIGKTYSQQIVVSDKDTALAYGSGNLPVFATPAMTALMENTAVHCLEGELEPGTDTVGIAINVQHTKATAIGHTVVCQATITETEGRRIRFEITAQDDQGDIGHAIHDRFVIVPKKFMSKL